MNNDRLPRNDLQEKQCRRFEFLIARALKMSFEYDPKDMPTERRGMNPRTFVARFYDAMHGFELYRYSSEVIPRNFTRSGIKAYATASGKVQIVNEAWEVLNKAQRTMNNGFDESEAVREIKEFTHEKYLSSGKPHATIKGCYDECLGKEFPYETEAQASWLMKKIKELQAKAEFMHSEKRKVITMIYSDYAEQ